LAGEMFKQLADTRDLGHVPYKGAGPGISDLVSGHIPIMMLNVTNQAIELHNTGKIRILAVLTSEPLTALPNVPTGHQTLPNLVAMLFTGLFAPAGTPKEIVDRIAQANHSVMSNEAFRNARAGATLHRCGALAAVAAGQIHRVQDRLGKPTSRNEAHCPVGAMSASTDAVSR
jgi:tripartite-type tricarboxylate transporter receptor subunit TctC